MVAVRVTGAVAGAVLAAALAGCGGQNTGGDQPATSSPSPAASGTQQVVLEQMAAYHERLLASGEYAQMVATLGQRAASAKDAGGENIGALASLASMLSTPNPDAGNGWTTESVQVQVVVPDGSVAPDDVPLPADGRVTQSFPSYSGVAVVPAYDGALWSATLRSPAGDVCAVFADTEAFSYEVRPGPCPAADTTRAQLALQMLGSS